MKNTAHSKLVRALTLVIIAVCAAVSLVPHRQKGSVKKSLPIMDLTPNITRGLNLIGLDALPPTVIDAQIGAHIGVYDGEKVMPMDLREYLIGVTAAEMPASYGLEALKAQAVAARTFTMKHVTGELRCKKGYTICTDHTCCQAYASVEKLKKVWGDDFEKYYAKVTEAVDATEDLVLTSEGELVTALYHSSSGGKTENSEAVFAVALPYLVSVESAGEESSSVFHSTERYTKDEFTKIINTAFPDADMHDPEKDIDVWQRTESGRVSLIRLGGTVVSGQRLRSALSLQSTNVEFAFDGDTVEVSCLGHGHGVGMSQVGANAMAREGADFEEILKHYYTGVEIEPFGTETQIWRILSGKTD